MNQVILPTHGNFKDFTGRTFNRLTVIEYSGKKNNAHYWLCECSCKNKKIVRSSHLRDDGIQSCGCIGKEALYNIKHQKCNSSEYHTWNGMKSRCLNKEDPNYGGRGIIVCERWLESFNNFYEDMGPRPSKEYSLDRIDVNGNYCKENCRWATKVEQANNKRNNILLTYKSQTLSIIEWSKITNIKIGTIEARIRYGWSEDKILSTPVNHYNRKQ